MGSRAHRGLASPSRAPSGPGICFQSAAPHPGGGAGRGCRGLRSPPQARLSLGRMDTKGEEDRETFQGPGSNRKDLEIEVCC